jgi:hypothetical protein
VGVEFDLGVCGLEHSDGAKLVGALRALLEGAVNPIRVKFVWDDEALTFDVLQAEPKAAYDLNPIRPRRTDDGGWIVAEPIAKPPGDIELDWMQVNKDVVLLRGEALADAEFAEWLRTYAKVLSYVHERSALVIGVDSGVENARLFFVLKLLASHGLDRFLVERQAQQAGAGQPATTPESKPEAPQPPRYITPTARPPSQKRSLSAQFSDHAHQRQDAD